MGRVVALFAMLLMSFVLPSFLAAQTDLPFRVIGTHEGTIQVVAFSPDGALLASGSDDKTVKIWRVGDLQLVYTIAAHDKGVKTLAFSSDGTLLVTAGGDGIIRIWRTFDWTQVRELTGHKKEIDSLALSPDGSLLVSGADDGVIRIWRVADGAEIHAFRGQSWVAHIRSVDFSPSGDFIAYATRKTFDTPDGENSISLNVITSHDYIKVWSLWGSKKFRFGPLAFSSDGSHLAGTIEDYNTGIGMPPNYYLKIWNVRPQQELATVRLADEARSLAFAPDGKTLAVGEGSKVLRIIQNAKSIYETRCTGDVYALDFSPDGRFLATGGKSKELLVWDLSDLNLAGDTLATAPMYPPDLVGTITFSEPSGNNLLDAEEESTIVLNLTNQGRGVAYGIQVYVSIAEPVSDLQFTPSIALERLNPAESKSLTILVKAGRDVPTRNVAVGIAVTERNGFGLPAPLSLRFSTQELITPQLALDYGIEDQNSNKKIEPREMFKVTAQIQNIGQGIARAVEVEVAVGDNVFFEPESRSTFTIGDLNSGEHSDISFWLFTNNRAQSVPITITAREKYGQFGFSKPLDIAFNEVQKKLEEITIVGSFHQVREVAIAPSLVVDIDLEIPQTGAMNFDAVAVIIGNKNYKSAAVPTVQFAQNDAVIVREYLKKQFGFQDGNIIYQTDAGFADFNRIFGSEKNPQGQLADYVKPGISEVFVYYSGHGAPDPDTKQGYFVPVDCDPQSIELNGYSLETFYRNLAVLPCKSITVVIDACFSGGSGGGMILRNMSPVFIEVNLQTELPGTVFLSTGPDQVSAWYPDRQHSMFTYFFLKGIAGAADFDGDRDVRVGELETYLTDRVDGVPYWAKRLHQISQMPVVFGDRTRSVTTY